MKNTRRGLGKGLGVGYKNLAPMDSHIHRLSAKGIKTFNPESEKYWKSNPQGLANYKEQLKEMQGFKFIKDSKTGKSYPRIKYGDEGDGWGNADYCPDCGVAKGMYHQANCDIERSPIPSERGRQLLTSDRAGDYSLNAKGWNKFEQDPKKDGNMQLFLLYKKGKLEYEVTRYYDDDKGKYDNYYSVFRQIESDDGDSWDGQEMGTFKTLKEAKDFAKELTKSKTLKAQTYKKTYSKTQAIETAKRGRRLLFQDKAHRDEVYKELTRKGLTVKRGSRKGQVLHPEYVEDYEGEVETGFGNTMYQYMFPTLYTIEVKR